MSQETASKTRFYGDVLNDAERPLKERFRALFALRNLGGAESVAQIGRGFGDPSALLKHELAYCLGQMRHVAAVPLLCRVLADVAQDSMVRHEAGEALGAIGDPAAVAALSRFAADAAPEVAETCELALRRIEWSREGGGTELERPNAFGSVDPAPAEAAGERSPVDLYATLTDADKSMWQRYRALFSLRDLCTDEAAVLLGRALTSDRSSALLRHELAFVLGQMRRAAAAASLAERLADGAEHEMVRHECAEALGAVAAADCADVLRPFLDDERRVVRESCEVALDLRDYALGDQLNYAVL